MNQRRPIFTLLLVLLVLLCAWPTPAQGKPMKPAKPDTITAYVTADNHPLAGAIVLLVVDAWPPPYASAVLDHTTDKQGQTTFPAQVGRVYHLTVGAPGYLIWPLVYDFKFTGGTAQFSFVATKAKE
jgi:hypothetical protein